MSSIKLFENKQVRSQWDEECQAWFFSIVDVVGLLTDSPKPRTYWSVLKTRLKKEGSELATNCSQLKMRSADGNLVLNMLAEATTTEISREKQPDGFEEKSREIAQQGGTIAGNTRKAIEAKSGKPIISAKNAKQLK